MSEYSDDDVQYLGSDQEDDYDDNGHQDDVSEVSDYASDYLNRGRNDVQSEVGDDDVQYLGSDQEEDDDAPEPWKPPGIHFLDYSPIDSANLLMPEDYYDTIGYCGQIVFSAYRILRNKYGRPSRYDPEREYFYSKYNIYYDVESKKKKRPYLANDHYVQWCQEARLNVQWIIQYGLQTVKLYELVTGGDIHPRKDLLEYLSKKREDFQRPEPQSKMDYERSGSRKIVKGPVAGCDYPVGCTPPPLDNLTVKIKCPRGGGVRLIPSAFESYIQEYGRLGLGVKDRKDWSNVVNTARKNFAGDS